MKYFVTVNKEYHYVKVYRIIKKINDATNPISIKFQALVDRIVGSKARNSE